LETGEVRLDTRNPGDVVTWIPDAEFRIRAATALDPKDASTILRVRDTADSPWRNIVVWRFEQAASDRYQRILGFTAEGSALYVQSPIGTDNTRLVKLSVADGRELETLAADPRRDLWNVYDPSRSEEEVQTLFHPREDRLQAVAFNGLKPEWKALDPSLA